MIDLDKLRKVHALTGSPNQHEAAVAWGKVDAMLARGGKGRADLSGLLGEPRPAGPTFEDIFYGSAAGREAHLKKQAGRRATVVERYGSEEAVLAPTAMERTVDAALTPLGRRIQKRYANGTFEVDSLAGWTDGIGETMPASVRRYVEGAMPLPGTVPAALAEMKAWDDREQDLQQFHGDAAGDYCPSLACRARREIVRDLFWKGLRARTAADIAIRQRELLGAQGCEPSGTAEALLRDLEALAAAEAPSQPAGSLPPEVDALDAPRGMPGDQPIGWARGWNACREAMMKEEAAHG